jgi:hypothetical protein
MTSRSSNDSAPPSKAPIAARPACALSAAAAGRKPSNGPAANRPECVQATQARRSDAGSLTGEVDAGGLLPSDHTIWQPL